VRRTPIRRTARKVNAQRYTGPSPTVKALVIERSGGRCERCGRYLGGPALFVTYSLHHRLPRGMGGSSSLLINSPANIALLCGSGTSGCHGEVEAQRTKSYASGWLVRRGDDPAQTPILLYDQRWYVLTASGKRVAS